MVESAFLKVVCPRCTASNIVFNKASTPVKCRSCNLLLTKNRGGKAKIMASVKEVL